MQIRSGTSAIPHVPASKSKVVVKPGEGVPEERALRCPHCPHCPQSHWPQGDESTPSSSNIWVFRMKQRAVKRRDWRSRCRTLPSIYVLLSREGQWDTSPTPEHIPTELLPSPVYEGCLSPAGFFPIVRNDHIINKTLWIKHFWQVTGILGWVPNNPLIVWLWKKYQIISFFASVEPVVYILFSFEAGQMVSHQTVAHLFCVGSSDRHLAWVYKPKQQRQVIASSA